MSHRRTYPRRHGHHSCGEDDKQWLEVDGTPGTRCRWGRGLWYVLLGTGVVPWRSREDREGDGMRYSVTVTGEGGGRWLTVGFGGSEFGDGDA
jgi:hypothetical protein